MKINRIHKTAERPPDFPCYLWHAENRTYILAYSAEVFLDGWEPMYPYWHENDRDWPEEQPPSP